MNKVEVYKDLVKKESVFIVLDERKKIKVNNDVDNLYEEINEEAIKNQKTVSILENICIFGVYEDYHNCMLAVAYEEVLDIYMDIGGETRSMVNEKVDKIMIED